MSTVKRTSVPDRTLPTSHINRQRTTSSPSHRLRVYNIYAPSNISAEEISILRLVASPAGQTHSRLIAFWQLSYYWSETTYYIPHSLKKPDHCAQVWYMSVTRLSPSPERVWPARLPCRNHAAMTIIIRPVRINITRGVVWGAELSYAH